MASRVKIRKIVGAAEAERLKAAGRKPAAFTLQRYIDKVTGEIEVVWNSRPGAIASEIDSRAGNDAPIDPDFLVHAPDFVPMVGDRVFVDMTETRARQLAEQRLQDIERGDTAQDREIRDRMMGRFPSREAALVEGTAAMLKRNCDLVTVTSGWLEGFKRARAEAAAASTATAPHAAYDLSVADEIMQLPSKLRALVINSAKRQSDIAARLVPQGTSLALPIDFRDTEGNLIDRAQWVAMHATPTVVGYDRVFQHEALEVYVLTGWTGVDPGDGCIWDTALLFRFYIGDRSVESRVMAVSTSLEKALCAHATVRDELGDPEGQAVLRTLVDKALECAAVNQRDVHEASLATVLGFMGTTFAAPGERSGHKA